MKFHRIVFIALLSLFTIFGQAQKKIVRLGNNNGLSNSSVNTILKDRNGLMWFGTWDGLNYYDGVTFYSFRPDIANPNALSNPVVRNIFQDLENGSLWVATDFGINNLSLEKNQFRKFFLGYENKNIIREKSFLMARNSRNEILAVADESSVHIFNREQQQFVALSLPFIQNTIIQLFFDRFDTLWCLDKKFNLYKIDFSASKSTCVQTIALSHLDGHVLYDGDQHLWFTAQNKLKSINVTNSKIDNETETWSCGQLNCVNASTELVEIGTTDGLYYLNNGKLQKDADVGNVSVLSIMHGEQGITWIGTDNKGILQIIPVPEPFSTFTPEQIPDMGNFAVRAIYSDRNNRLWIGSKGGGLTCVDYLGAKSLQRSRRFTIENGLNNNSVFSLTRNDDEHFWIGTDGYGLSYYSAISDQIKILDFKGMETRPNLSSVYCVLQDNDSTIWVGTSGHGLFKVYYKYNREEDSYAITRFYNYIYTSDKAHNHISSNIVYSIVRENDSILWVATRGGGLDRLNTHTNYVRTFKASSSIYSLTSNDVISLFKDSAGRIWVGTSNGLNIAHQEQGKVTFSPIFESNGLANNNIHSIREDAMGYFWVSTSKGLSRISADISEITNFAYNSGLQDNEFSDGACFCEEGAKEIYFGGINGFSIVHINRMKENSFSPNLLVTGLNIDNKTYSPFQTIDKEIVLSYKQEFIKFNFAVLDYQGADRCQLAYKLVSDKEDANDSISKWVNIGSVKNIILTGIPDGSYRLLVRHSNKDGVWSEEIMTIHLRITPPLWRSTYAFVFYVLLILLLFYLFNRFQKYKLNVKHSIEIEELEKKKIEEIHQAKLRFFTNIAHEFSNSITLIYGSCEQIFENNTIKGNDRQHLIIIRKNAQRMQNQIQQLMEFRKAETGYLSVKYENIDFPELIKCTLDNFLDLAASKNLNVRIQIATGVRYWVSDMDMMEKVIFNLLSNAMKYTPSDGFVEVSLSTDSQGENLIFSCKNSGTGLTEEQQKLIFNRFKVLDLFESNLKEGKFKRTGIGLSMCQNLIRVLHGNISVSSKLNEFTCFTVEIPMGEISEDNITLNSQEDFVKNAQVRETLPDTVSHSEMKEEEDSVSALLPSDNKMHFLKPALTTRKSILVVDDQNEILQLICSILGNDYQINTALNGIQALGTLAKDNVDLIISDIIMPEMDGVTLLKELKKDERYKYIPVILLSSKANVDVQIEGLELGATMFLAKPFHPQHLKAVVSRTLNEQSLMKEFADSPMAHMERYNGVNLEKPDMDFLNKALFLLAKNLDNEDYKQEQLSEDLAMSKIQFYRKIKKVTSSTPAEFIRTFRLHEAEKMLLHTDKNVNEIMNDCGFRNKAYFYREFANMYSCTPKEYRQKKMSSDNL